MKFRIHLRDTGSIKRHFAFRNWKSRGWGWGANLVVGRLLLAIRENTGEPHRRGKFLELDMGRAMRARKIREDAMTPEEWREEWERRYEQTHGLKGGGD